MDFLKIAFHGFFKDSFSRTNKDNGVGFLKNIFKKGGFTS